MTGHVLSAVGRSVLWIGIFYDWSGVICGGKKCSVGWIFYENDTILLFSRLVNSSVPRILPLPKSHHPNHIFYYDLYIQGIND